MVQNVRENRWLCIVRIICELNFCAAKCAVKIGLLYACVYKYVQTYMYVRT